MFALVKRTLNVVSNCSVSLFVWELDPPRRLELKNTAPLIHDLSFLTLGDDFKKIHVVFRFRNRPRTEFLAWSALTRSDRDITNGQISRIHRANANKLPIHLDLVGRHAPISLPRISSSQMNTNRCSTISALIKVQVNQRQSLKTFTT